MHPLLTLFTLRAGDLKNPIGATVFGLTRDRKICPTCQEGKIGRLSWDAGNIEILATRTRFFPDLIGGLGPPVISERVKQDMAAAKITGFRAHKTRVWVWDRADHRVPIPDLTKDDWEAELAAAVQEKFPMQPL